METLRRYESVVPDFDAFLAALQEPLPTTVRVNTIRSTVDRTVAALEDAGVDVTEHASIDTVLERMISLPKLDGFEAVSLFFSILNDLATAPPDEVQQIGSRHDASVGS
jgi:16S rRNA C967 or C1407 C5-methylase (RsmB/RsmF family)